MKRVIIESPYAGDVETHVRYARRCVEHSLLRGEAPLASHLLYTQEGILDDNIQAQRDKGIEAGHAWFEVADYIVFYLDYGTSVGMDLALNRAEELGRPVISRQIGRNP